ncbi:MAG TPA: hypothetical protein VH856_07540 [Steroidobacteraceae bacterium]|jgi:hypothetical protein
MATAADVVAGAITGEPAQRRVRLSHVGLTLALLAILAGLVVPTERYLSPQQGLGYALGVVGGCLMLAMLVYSLRKRIPALARIGSVRFWFRTHMIFGVAGPLAILYHANFGLGATNSNVALACMLVVSGSGLVGRYLYSRIHHGLYGRVATLRELSANADGLRQHSGALRVLPGLLAEIEQAEARITAPSTMLLRPLAAAVRQRRERARILRLVTQAVAMAAARSAVLAGERDRLAWAAGRYAGARLVAARRVAEFESCERLFAAWHLLHLPLFTMLVIVGIVHVIAVHVY